MQQAMPSANALATKLLGFRDWGIYFQTHFKSEFVAAQCLDWRIIEIPRLQNLQGLDCGSPEHSGTSI
jgi:hypothetical protein